MRSREQVAELINGQLNGVGRRDLDKRLKSHYGAQELRVLTDYIYESEPENDNQRISSNEDYWRRD
jgi:hypothetical protein